jgi:hypothetical protein
MAYDEAIFEAEEAYHDAVGDLDPDGPGSPDDLAGMDDLEYSAWDVREAADEEMTDLDVAEMRANAQILALAREAYDGKVQQAEETYDAAERVARDVYHAGGTATRAAVKGD